MAHMDSNEFTCHNSTMVNDTLNLTADLEDFLVGCLREAGVRPKKPSTPERTPEEEYLVRLGEKALYRRLLADPLLDAVRFKWCYEHYGHGDIEEWRRFIDDRISREESKSVPSP